MRRLRLNQSKVQAAIAASKPISTTETVERSHAKQIIDLPREQLELIIQSIREGVKAVDIAGFFAEQGWLTVTDKSFRQYLGAFKRLYPDMIRGSSSNRLDQLEGVDPRQPGIDEEVLLDQLLRVQKQRIGVGLKFELDSGFSNKDLHKDIQTMRELIETKATINGRLKSGAGRPTRNSAPMSADASDALRKVDEGEQSQDRMVSITTELSKLVKARAG